MSTKSCCCSAGLEISNNFFAPELMFMEKYKVNRCIKVSVVSLTSLMKPFLFPVWALVGVFALPVIAIISRKHNDIFAHRPADYMKAWAFCVLGLGGIVTVMALTSTVVPLVGMAAIVLAAFTISFTIHIFRACKDPSSFTTDSLLNSHDRDNLEKI